MFVAFFYCLAHNIVFILFKIESWQGRRRSKSISSLPRTIRLVSEREFWIFLGIICTGSVCGTGSGKKLWEPERPGVVSRSIDMKAYMLCYRFNDMKSYFTYAFVSDSKTEADDPWYKIIELFDNSKRPEQTLSSHVTSMSLMNP